jgi:hypothetical protein
MEIINRLLAPIRDLLDSIKNLFYVTLALAIWAYFGKEGRRRVMRSLSWGIERESC